MAGRQEAILLLKRKVREYEETVRRILENYEHLKRDLEKAEERMNSYQLAIQVLEAQDDSGEEDSK